MAVGWRFAATAAATIAGFAFIVSTFAADGLDLRPSREDLASLVAERADEVAGLDARAAALRTQVKQDVRGQGAVDDGIATAQRRIDALLAPAGLTAVEGPAVTVILDDAPLAARSRSLAPGVPPPTPDDLVVHQQDVQAVVNALWSAGAESMTIMGQRVSAFTAVRCVGNTLLLHGKVYSPPFAISAIGDIASMLRGLDADPGVTLYRQYVDVYGLGYRVEMGTRIRHPVFSGGTRLRVATPLSG